METAIHSFASSILSSKDLRLLIFILSSIALFYLTSLISQKVFIPLIRKVTTNTKSKWDDIMFNSNLIKELCMLAAPIIMIAACPHVFNHASTEYYWISKVLGIFIVASFIKLTCTFFNALYLLSNENQRFKNRTLKGVFQMFKIIVICIGGIIIISMVIDKNPVHILTGLGAMAAVLMLVFKDPILGLVAGVQLSANDMLRPGDWITLPKHDADGEVIEVTLTTVKVQNWDKTIVTIPPYLLVSDSFQNWRGMYESGGRRIKRSINIDMNSIGFCSKEQMEKFKAKGWLKGMEESEGTPVNLSVLRNYLSIYLNSHPKVNKELTLMIRQLQPTAQGLPLELYFFSSTTDWIPYEHLQAEIFEHLLAVLPEFGIKAFQTPAGSDFAKA